MMETAVHPESVASLGVKTRCYNRSVNVLEKYPSLGIFILIAIAAILTGTFDHVRESMTEKRAQASETVIADPNPVLDSIDYWRSRIQKIGSESAYDEHVRLVTEGDIQRSHTLAHIFGSALYQEIGMDSVSVCDEAFAFGCLHEVFERVVDEFGIEGLRQSVVECTKDESRWHPCHHALGHGLVAFFGYDEAAVRDALEICHDGFDEDPINGCVGGVFMEFNLYTTEGPTIDPRSVDEHGWYYPCTAIDGKFHKACYFWLPQWWREILRAEGMESVAIFERMGEMCETVPDKAFTRECFERVGQHATYESDYDPPLAKKLCDAATSEPTYNFLCRSYSAFSFRYTDTRFQDEALAMCVEFEGDAREFCEKFARKEVNIGTAPELPHEYRMEKQ